MWTQTFVYTGNPKNVVQGLTTTIGSSAHASYCRDALSAILQACPNITGLTFRVHGESGIPRGNFAFWQTLFSALTPIINAGRPLDLDMHGKECLQGHIDAAIACGAKVTVSPKRWIEHQGLPYHQAWIRAREQSNESDRTVLDGQASRYGYSNFFKEGRKYGILHRLWPGSQRHLLWGDPVFAAGYGRTSSFCGSVGIEWNEPLSYKGRQGSGTPGGRCAYSDATLTPAYDYQKFLYTYRVWGRCIYNPDTNPETWRRYLVKQFGPAARYVEDALGNASRIVMLVTTCHGEGASNYYYWPEVYSNFAIVDGQPGMQDSDNPLRISQAFDPQLFIEIDNYVEALLSGTAFSLDKYFPIEFAQWCEDLGTAAATNLIAAQGSVPDKTDPAFRRLEVDVAIQSGLGLFFGRKWRAAVLWSIYRKTNDASAKTAAIDLYNSAKQAWSDLAARGSVYLNDITYNPQRGHWKDRIGAITSDINAMIGTTYSAVTAITTHPGPAPTAISTVIGRQLRPAPGASHTPPDIFTPGSALSLALNADADTTAVRLYYRHVNQAEAWVSVAMSASGRTFSATIPAAYTQTPYPLQYYFALTKGNSGVLFPGFDSTLANQPYYVVRSVKGSTSQMNPSHARADSRSALSNLVVFNTGRNMVIRYFLSRRIAASAFLFNAAGRIVASWYDSETSAGPREIQWDVKRQAISSGNYVVQIVAGDARISKVIAVNSPG
jgi:hypothetical protein